MKKSFMTGLATLLPLTLTLIIVVFFVNLLTKPFDTLVKSLFNYYGLFNQPFFIFSKEQVVFLSSKALILAFIFALVLLIGFLARVLFISAFIDLGSSLIHRIPLVNTVYKAFQEVMKTLFASQSTTFSQVVLVPYPHAGTYSIGLVTAEKLPEGSDEKRRNLVSVFVPGTPNPAMGFMLLFEASQIVPTDMKVEEAFKLVVSCGVVFPKTLQPTTIV